MQPTLFDPAADDFALWRRDSPRHKWRLIGAAATRLGALRLMCQSGDYIVKQGGADPNADRASEATPGAAEGQAG